MTTTPLRRHPRLLVLVTLALAGCSRTTEATQARAIGAIPEVALDASASGDAAAGAAKGADAGPAPRAPPESAFSIVARGPTSGTMFPPERIACALPLVQRLPGGGLVVASEYARARADAPGATLSVELVRGLEDQALYRPTIVQGLLGTRWVWSDASSAIFVVEEETGRSGPRITTFKQGTKGALEASRGSVGYFRPVVRDGMVLALERTAYEVPNSSMYPKGSGYEQNSWSLKPARVAVIGGKGPGPAPAIPPGVCTTAMSAAPDGTLAVAVDRCEGGDPGTGVLRFAPGAAQPIGKIVWFAPRKNKGDDPDHVEVVAASAKEIYVSEGDRLETWNGEAWSDDRPFPGDGFASLSRAPGGELWAALGGGRLVERAAGADAKWKDVALPLAPADRLDAEEYAAPTYQAPEFLKVDALPEDQAVRAESVADMTARAVDATTDEVIVLATVEREAFVLSTKARAAVARLPSLPVQQATIAKAIKRRVAPTPKDCYQSFLAFADGTTADAIRAALGPGGLAAADAGAGAGAGDAPSPKIGEATVEGQTRVVLYGGEREALVALASRLGKLGVKRLCGPPVIERSL